MEKLRPGTFKALPVEWQLGVAGTGTEQVGVSFRVTEGPCAGQYCSWRGFFGERSTQRTLESLEHCGWNGESLSKLEGMGTKEVEIVVDEEEFEGKRYLRVQWVNAPGRGMAMHKTMDPIEAEAFDKRMRAEILKRKQARGERSAAHSGPPGTEFPYGANKKDGPPV